MRILVTGSAGKIGSAQVKLLRENGHDVRTFDVRTTPDDAGEHVFGDLRDIMRVREAMRSRDAVIHLGAIANDRAGREDDIMAVNVQGTFNVLLAAAESGVGRVVYFSSVNALGCFGELRTPLRLPVEDSYPRHPLTAYQLSKHLAEETCKAFSARYDMVTISLRPMLVLYPQQYERFQQRMAGGGGRGGNPWLRHDFWSYVDGRDVCRAALLALTAEGVKNDAFLLAAADTLSPTPTAELIDENFPEIPWQDIDRDTYLRDNPFRSLVDCSHAADVLGWRPEFSWRDVSPAAE